MKRSIDTLGDTLGSIAVSLQEASKAFESFARAFGCAMRVESKIDLSTIMQEAQQALGGDYEYCR